MLSSIRTNMKNLYFRSQRSYSRHVSQAGFMLMFAAIVACSAVGDGGQGSPSNEWAIGVKSRTQQTSLLTLKRADEVIQAVTRGTAHATNLFPGFDGLVGAVIEGSKNNQTIVWFLPNGSAVFIGGTLVEASGHDLTKAALYSKGILLSPEDALAQAATVQSRGIIVGAKGPIVTILFDPNCVYCHSTYMALAQHVAAGDIRVRYVVIGLLKASSTPRAASILGSVHPSEALARNEVEFDKSHEEGGYPIDVAVAQSNTASVELNSALFNKAGAVGTPAFLYCSKASRSVKFTMGVAGDIKAFIADVAAAPARQCS